MSKKRAHTQKQKEKEKRKKKAQAQTSDILDMHYALAEWSKDPRTAAFHLMKILAMRPNAKDALLSMAQVQFHSKNYAEAACYYERAKGMGITPPIIEYCLGLSYFWAGIKPDRALKNFEEFIKKTESEKDKEIKKFREYAVQYCNLLVTRLMLRDTAPARGVYPQHP